MLVTLSPPTNIPNTASSINTYLHQPAKVPFLAVTIDPMLLEYLSIRYAEKQVEGIDENFIDYNYGIRLPHYTSGIPAPPPGLNYLVEKVFSGDVSGDIGESLFAYLMTMTLGINSDYMAHLRPEKTSHELTPDFLVWDAPNALVNIFGRPNNLPIYAEAKSSANKMSSTRIEHALMQLDRVMGSGDDGLLFILERGSQGDYEGTLVGVVK